MTALKHPEWHETDPLQQLINVRRKLTSAFDDWCREDNHKEFRVGLANLLNQLAMLQPYIDGVASWYDKPTKKLIACFGPYCASRRIHHTRPDTPRGTQYVDVPLEFTGEHAFCSLKCQMYYYKGTLKDDKNRETQT
jgi:hypothetical protein